MTEIIFDFSGNPLENSPTHCTCKIL